MYGKLIQLSSKIFLTNQQRDRFEACIHVSGLPIKKKLQCKSSRKWKPRAVIGPTQKRRTEEEKKKILLTRDQNTRTKAHA